MVEFFDFGNAETFYFFQWLCLGGKVCVDALIAEAFRAVESDAWRELGFDLSRVAGEKLAELLEGEVVALKGRAAQEMGLDLHHGFNDAEMVGYAGDKALLGAFLADAMGKIDYRAAARALLVRHGAQPEYQQFDGNFPPEKAGLH